MLFILLVIALQLQGGEPRRVLLLHSFGHEFEPYTTFSQGFHSELAQSPEPLDFFDVALASARFQSMDEDAVVEYLSPLFHGRSVDLVVPMGGPAVRFAQKYRDRLFPDKPMLFTSIEQRMLQNTVLTANDAVIAVRHDPRVVVEAALRLLPDTTNVVVVFGNSPLEKFWSDEFGRQIEALTNHVGWESFSRLSFEQMKKRAAALPPHSVIVYGQVLVDTEGIPQGGEDALVSLHAVANAPIFGIHDFQLGHGIVGGPLVSVRESARQSASAAARILKGESPASFRPAPLGPGVPTYDWRELRRWKISENQLPPGSIVKFRQRTIWERHRGLIISGLSVCAVQGLLIFALCANLIKRRQAELLLRASEERMKLAAGAAQLGFWEWDFASDKLWVAGGSHDRMAAPANGDSDYRSFMQTVHPDDRDTVAQAVAKALSGEGSYEIAHRRVLPDGQVRWISAQGRVEFDSERNPVRMRGVGMDITARKLAEDRARESERQFLLIANSSPVLIWTSGPDKLCTFVNQAWLKFRGRTLEQELGDGWAGGLHPEDCADALQVYTEAFDARESFTMLYRLLRHDGQYRWISDYGVPRYDTDKTFLGYTGSCVDLTERKETEAAAQRLQRELEHVSRVSSLSELAGSLAHELNQPLTVIVSSAEAAERLMNDATTNQEEVCEALKDILAEGYRAGEIISKNRAMLRKDLGQMAGQDLNLAVKEVMEMVRSDLVIRQVAPVLRLDPLLPLVCGHAVQLRQVLLNLVINACDAMADVPVSQRQLSIESRRVTDHELEVSVADTGPGFPEEMLRREFEPFHTTKAKGLGLGLTISHSIIRTHGGRLAAANNHGGGATLRLTLPAQIHRKL